MAGFSERGANWLFSAKGIPSEGNRNGGGSGKVIAGVLPRGRLPSRRGSKIGARQGARLSSLHETLKQKMKWRGGKILEPYHEAEGQPVLMGGGRTLRTKYYLEKDNTDEDKQYDRRTHIMQLLSPNPHWGDVLTDAIWPAGATGLHSPAGWCKAPVLNGTRHNKVSYPTLARTGDTVHARRVQITAQVVWQEYTQWVSYISPVSPFVYDGGHVVVAVVRVRNAPKPATTEEGMAPDLQRILAWDTVSTHQPTYIPMHRRGDLDNDVEIVAWRRVTPDRNYFREETLPNFVMAAGEGGTNYIVVTTWAEHAVDVNFDFELEGTIKYYRDKRVPVDDALYLYSWRVPGVTAGRKVGYPIPDNTRFQYAARFDFDEEQPRRLWGEPKAERREEKRRREDHPITGYGTGLTKRRGVEE